MPPKRKRSKLLTFLFYTNQSYLLTQNNTIMNKNRLFLTACILLLSSHCLHAQCWIMTVDRGNYFSEIKDLSTAKDRILVQVGNYKAFGIKKK